MYARYVPPKKAAAPPVQRAAAQNDDSLPPVRPTSWSAARRPAEENQPSLPILPQGRKITFDDNEPSESLREKSKKITVEETDNKTDKKEDKKTDDTPSKKKKTEKLKDEPDKKKDKKSKKHEKDKHTEEHPEKNTENHVKEHGEESSTKADKKRKIDDISADEKITARHQAVLQKKDKSIKRAKEQAKSVDENETPDEPLAETHGLHRFLLPERDEEEAIPTDEEIPEWLKNPDRVAPNTGALFSEFKIGNERAIAEPVEEALKKQGWTKATAIQTAVLPMLLPSCRVPRDLFISASTGSGKTLAYVLPIMREISRLPVTTLTAVVVVPTRELVHQVHDVCTVCARAFASVPGSKKPKIGIAVGHQPFEVEKRNLINPSMGDAPDSMARGWRPRLELYGLDLKDLMFDTHGRNRHGFNLGFTYDSAVDILICTPGRLVDHINLTPGFSLDHLRWLVIDEADKLLGQVYQQWLDTVLDKLAKKDSNKGLYRGYGFDETARKIFLSATMRRDKEFIKGLQLRRPRYVALEGRGNHIEANGDEDDAEDDNGNDTKSNFVLPEELHESAIKVRDESQKPLYLIDLLNSKHMTGPATSDTSSSSSSSDEDEEDEEHCEFKTTAVIFARSNENVLRLSRLLALLAPKLGKVMSVVTSTTRTSDRRKTLRDFEKGKLRILVSSDLAGRGIDLKNIDHVINFDMPLSVANYVHRVGRTARAGRSGHAWTFFSKKEAGWFWAEVAGEKKKKNSGNETVRIHRQDKVAKVLVGDGGRFDEARLDAFNLAIKQLEKEDA